MTDRLAGARPTQAYPSGSTTSPASGSRPATWPSWSPTPHVVGVTTNPTIFAARLADGDALRRADRGARRRRRGRRGQPFADHDDRRALGLRRAAPGLRRHRRRRRPGLDRGRPAAGRTTPRHHRRGQGAVVSSSTGPTCSSRSRRPSPGPSGDHRGHRRGHQRQRHADLLPRALPRRDGRLPRRVSSRPRRQRPRPVARSTRWRRSSSAGSTPRSTSGSTRSARRGQGARARRRSPTRGWPTRRYEEFFASERWAALEAAGAHTQRPLWASTGVKDPAYPDTMYVTELAAPDTSTRCRRRRSTPRRPRGGPRRRGHRRLRGRPAGHRPTRGRRGRLRRRGPAARGRGRRQVREVVAGAAADRSSAELDKAERMRAVRSPSRSSARVSTGARRPAGRATRSPAGSPPRTPAVGARRREPRHRSGWAGSGCPSTSRPLLAEIEALRAELRAEGLDRVVLCGMGGSSLAPEVITRHARVSSDGARLDRPRLIRRALDRGLERTVVVVSSKSGGTVETDSQRRAFEQAFKDGGHRRGVAFRGGHRPGLAARRAGERGRLPQVFLADPDVGGRYCALTAFGLVPSGLAGVDIADLLDEAEEVMSTRWPCDDADNPALRARRRHGRRNGAATSSSRRRRLRHHRLRRLGRAADRRVDRQARHWRPPRRRRRPGCTGDSSPAPPTSSLATTRTRPTTRSQPAIRLRRCPSAARSARRCWYGRPRPRSPAGCSASTPSTSPTSRAPSRPPADCWTTQPEARPPAFAERRAGARLRRATGRRRTTCAVLSMRCWGGSTTAATSPCMAYLDAAP